VIRKSGQNQRTLIRRSSRRVNGTNGEAFPSRRGLRRYALAPRRSAVTDLAPGFTRASE
jgi:hypothetical protein